MTYLELCQRVRQESGISGVGPTTVAGQQGQLSKIVEWVKAAWLEIQNEREDWQFMWGTLTFDTVANQDAFTVDTTDIKYFDWVRIYEKSLGKTDENELPEITYRQMREDSKIGVEETDRPISFSIRPDKAIVLAPTPVEIYTITADYYQLPQVLTDNADIPTLPVAYHDIIVYKALMMFAAHFEANMQYQHAAAQYARLMANLEMNQLPRMTLTGPLA